ncbi:MAG TPA: hypothetical protein VFQ23_06220, partial [Anaerolineales bacterium]|nr:hypothetical protein [Anaerolineales bacterium]
LFYASCNPERKTNMSPNQSPPQAELIHRPKWRRRLPLIGLTFGTLAFLWWYFSKLFKCPSCYLFVDSADGLKNYFTSVYYVMADSGLWFSGMNYPYGDHIVYTDNQPFWSGMMKLASSLTAFDGHVVGTINMLMVFSILISVICIYLLLRRMQLPVWMAIVGCLPIAFLSPQIARFNGHYSLAYTCYIPAFLCLMFWWCDKPQSIKRAVFLVLWIAVMSYTHLYFLFISVCFLTVYGFVVWGANRFRWNRAFLNLIVVVAIAGAVVYLPVKLTDPIDDRPTTVYGIQVYTSKAAGTFLPWFAPMDKILTDELKIKRPDGEAMSYVGFPGLILCIFIVIFMFRRTWLNWRKPVLSNFSLSVTPMRLLATGIIVWIISTGWFYIIGGSVLLEVFPVLGQFRSLGRLGWIFYYAYTLFVVWYLFDMLKRTGKPFVRTLIILLVGLLVSVWYWEAWKYLDHQTKGIYHENKTFRGEEVYRNALQNIGVDPQEFQAILQVPLVSVGSERINIARGLWTLNRTYQCATETGLPIINSNMSRTSVSQSLELLQLISDPDIPKRRLELMNEKPLLLLADHQQLIDAEKKLVQKGVHLTDVQDLSLYGLPLEAFHRVTEPAAEKQVLATNLFDDIMNTEGFNGSGALHTMGKGETIMEFTSPDSDTLYFEYWAKITHDGVFFPAIAYQWYKADGSLGGEEVLSMHNYNPFNVVEQWIQSTMQFVTMPERARHVFIALERDGVFDECRIYKPVDNTAN